MWSREVNHEVKVFFVVFFHILRHETEGIVERDRRKVEGKVENIKTDGKKEKIQ